MSKIIMNGVIYDAEGSIVEHCEPDEVEVYDKNIDKPLSNYEKVLISIAALAKAEKEVTTHNLIRCSGLPKRTLVRITKDLDVNQIYKAQQFSHFRHPEMMVICVIPNSLFTEVCKGFGTTPRIHIGVDHLQAWSGAIYTFSELDLIFIHLGFSIFQNNNNEIDINENGIHKLLGTCFTLGLKQDGYFHKHTVLNNSLLAEGQALHQVTIKSLIGSGKIPSSDNNLRLLLEETRKIKFLEYVQREGNYIVGSHSFKYQPTERGLSVMSQALNIFKLLRFKEPTKRKLVNDFYLPLDIISKIKPRDTYLLLAHTEGYRKGKGFLIKNDITDRQESRKYSLFTSISGNTRLNLGYTGYDINSALQSIVFNFLDSDLYPVHKMLITDKKKLRNQIAKEIEKDYDYVKTLLTKIDNGGSAEVASKKSKLVADYIAEAGTMATSFNNHFLKNNREVYNKALLYAKNEIRWYYDDNNVRQCEELETKNKYSLFFFIWTQIEREIRNVMIKSFKGFCHEVHDAIYSYDSSIDVNELEINILNELGLEISITKETL